MFSKIGPSQQDSRGWFELDTLHDPSCRNQTCLGAHRTASAMSALINKIGRGSLAGLEATWHSPACVPRGKITLYLKQGDRPWDCVWSGLWPGRFGLEGANGPAYTSTWSQLNTNYLSSGACAWPQLGYSTKLVQAEHQYSKQPLALQHLA